MGITVTHTQDWTWQTIPLAWQDDAKPWTEQGVIDFTLAIAENLTIAEALAFDRVIALSESLGVSDSLSRKVTAELAEAFQIADALICSTTFTRDFAESFAIDEASARDIGLNINEAWQLVDQWVRKAHAVISDLKITTTEIKDADFQNLLAYGGMVGYADFRPFIPGDYQLQKGAVRYVMKSLSDDRASLAASKVTVDVPDIQDRGTATTSAAGYVTVPFNRTFTVAPEVTAILKGGTALGTLRIDNVTTTGFDVRLEQDATTFLVATISWSALGY